MQIAMPSLISESELAAIEQYLPLVNFVDGKTTAGKYAKTVKKNHQAMECSSTKSILAKIEKSLWQSPLFISAVRPKAIIKMLLSRYQANDFYGWHVDDAMMNGRRTDVSFTVFLGSPESYEGGSLLIDDHLEIRSIKLAAGSAIIYPSSSIHQVETVSEGERYVVVGWVQSWVRSPEQRALLFNIDQAIDSLPPDHASLTLLLQCRSNLLRSWID